MEVWLISTLRLSVSSADETAVVILVSSSASPCLLMTVSGISTWNLRGTSTVPCGTKLLTCTQLAPSFVKLPLLYISPTFPFLILSLFSGRLGLRHVSSPSVTSESRQGVSVLQITQPGLLLERPSRNSVPAGPFGERSSCKPRI